MAAEVAVGDQITTGTVALCCDRVGGACCEHVVAEFGCDPVGAVVVGVVVTVTVGSDDDCAVVTAEAGCDGHGCGWLWSRSDGDSWVRF